MSLLRLRGLLDALLAWALLASTAVVATVLLAGAVFDELEIGVVLLLASLLATALVVVRVLSRRPLSLPDELLATIGERFREVSADRWLLLLGAAVIIEVAWRLAIAFVMPPYAGDALWYHLTTIGEWLRAGAIGPSELVLWSTVYPHNAELLFAWTALLLGRDTLVDAVQLPFGLMAAVAVSGLGRSAGLSRRGAAAAGCLFFLTPIVLSQTTASYTDLIFIAFFLAAMHFMLRFLAGLRGAGAPERTALALSGVAAGLALGTKGLGFVYVGVLALLLVGHLVVAAWTRRRGLGELGVDLLLFVVPLVALGAYHYVEIWSAFGSPVHPVRIALFGWEIFPGRPIELFLSDAPGGRSWWSQVWGQWHRDHFFLTEPRFHAYSYDGRPSGLGPLWSYLALPLVLVFAALAARTNRPLLVNLLLPVALMFAVQPYRWWSRFTMILAAVGAIAVCAVIEALPSRWANRLKVFVLVLVALGAAFPTLKIDGEFWATEIASVARLPADERTIGRVALPGYRWVDATPAGATIGVSTSAGHFGAQPYVLPYPLFGPRFENDVRPLPASEAQLRASVASGGLDYVFVPRGRQQDAWMARLAAAGCARRIYDGPVYAGHAGRAYRIVRRC